MILAAAVSIFSTSTMIKVVEKSNDLLTSGHKKHHAQRRRKVHSCFDEGRIRWTDTSGHRIEAHGAGLLQSPLDGRWYWYGESKKYPQALWNWTAFDPFKRSDRMAILARAAPGVNVYSAQSIAGPWQFEGQALGQTSINVAGRTGPWVIERPKVLYNKKSRHFVMWVHLEDSEYQFRHAGVAISETATGPFKFLHALQPDGIPSLDMSLFLDPLDGQAYFIRSCDNKYTGISRVSADFLNTTGLINKSRLFEGMGLFRLPNGTYYCITSHLTGWNPNPLPLLRSAGSSLEDPRWVNMGNPTYHPTSFNSQPTFVVQFTPEFGSPYFVYLADNWVHGGQRGLEDAAYVWLPFRFTDDAVTLEAMGAWDLEHPFQTPSRGPPLAPL